MKIEWRLNDLIENARLGEEFTGYGRFVNIAKATGVPRKVIKAILENRKSTVSLDHLEKICAWLLRMGVQADLLPGALIRTVPSKLIALLAKPGRVTMYVGEYRHPQARPIHRAWVSQADAAVSSMFVELLSGSSGKDQGGAEAASSGIRFEQIYIPSHITPFEANEPDAEGERNSILAAEACFDRMCRDRTAGAHILIGSQRANYLVELFVSDLFSLDAFKHAPGALPFYLYIGKPRPHTPASCFGGTEWLPGKGHKKADGICYRGEGKKWEICPGVQNIEDSGIVILRRMPGTDRTHLAVFGYSGQATMALGKVFERDPDLFWKERGKNRSGVEISITLCRLSFRPPDPSEDGSHHPELEGYEVIPLHTGILAKSRARAR